MSGASNFLVEIPISREWTRVRSLPTSQTTATTYSEYYTPQPFKTLAYRPGGVLLYEVKHSLFFRRPSTCDPNQLLLESKPWLPKYQRDPHPRASMRLHSTASSSEVGTSASSSHSCPSVSALLSSEIHDNTLTPSFVRRRCHRMGSARRSTRVQEGEQPERESVSPVPSRSPGCYRRGDACRLVRLREGPDRTEGAREGCREGKDVPYLGCPPPVKS